jgi:O-antigen/teichoic acid export membrane protein
VTGPLKELLANGSWVLSASSARTALAFGKSVLLVRGLGTDGYGSYVFITVLVATSLEFTNLNLATVFTKFGADSIARNAWSDLKRLYRTLGLVTAGCMGVGALVAAALLLGPDGTKAYTAAIQWPVLVLVAVAMSAPPLESLMLARVKLLGDFKSTSLLATAASFMEVAAVAAAVLVRPGDLEVLLVLWSGARVLITVLHWLVCRSRFMQLEEAFRGANHAGVPISTIAHPNPAAVRLPRGIWSFALKNSLARTGATLLDRGDVLILGALAQAGDIALYDVAKKLGYLFLRLTDPLMDAVFPQVARQLSSGNRSDTVSVWARSSALVAVAAVAFMAGVLAFGGWALVEIFGEDLMGAYPALVWHAAGASVSGILYWAVSGVIVTNRLGFRIAATFAVALIAGLGAVYVLPADSATIMAGFSAIAKAFLAVTLAATAVQAVLMDRTPLKASGLA